MDNQNNNNEQNERQNRKLEKLINQYRQYSQDLNNAIENKDQRLVTLYRGRLIKTISKLISQKGVSNEEKLTLKNEMQSLLEAHKEQLRSRIATEKNSGQNYSIPKEIGLKLKKTAASVKEIKAATDAKERVGAVLKTAGNGLSTLFSVSKLALKPAGFVVQKAAGAAIYFTGVAVSIPVELFARTVGKVFNPDRPYSISVSQQFGGILKEMTEEVIEKLNEGVMKL